MSTTRCGGTEIGRRTTVVLRETEEVMVAEFCGIVRSTVLGAQMELSNHVAVIVWSCAA